MTVVYTVDAFDKIDEFLVFEIDIPKEKLSEISKIMNWSISDYEDFVAGLGGFNLTDEQVKSLERILNKTFFREDLDFQISAGEV